jgi:uncharacterized repeat protein (TIGR02543 family)
MKKILAAFCLAALLGVAGTSRAQTAGDYYTNGLNDLAVSNLDAADIDFSNAVRLAPTDPTNNTFYAITQILTVADQPAVSNFLNQIGFSSPNRGVFNRQSWKLSGVPATNGDAITGELYSNAIPVYISAQTNFANVTATNFILALTTNQTHLANVSMDWGDIQVLRSLCDTFELFIYEGHSQGLPFQLNLTSNYFGPEGNFQEFLTNFPSAFTLVSTNDLPAAQGAFTNAINTYFAASQFIRARAPGQTYLFNLKTNDLTRDAQFRQVLSNLLASLTVPTPPTSNANFDISMAAFFSPSFSFGDFLPRYEGNKFVLDTFPDVTFGGMFTGTNVTENSIGKIFGKHARGISGAPNYTITAAVSPINGGLVSNTVSGLVGGPEVVQTGSTESFVAIPASGYEFVGWTGDRSAIGNTLNFTVTTNLSITANFALIQRTFSLKILVHGDGTVSPNPTGQTLTAPHTYTLSARPAAGNIFSGWTGSVATSKNPLTLKVSTNFILQANFITNPFVPVEGIYNGLFMAGNSLTNVTETTAGMLKGLTVNQTGKYSGSILLGGASFSLSGIFAADLQATNLIKRTTAKGGLFSVALTIDGSVSPAQVTGLVYGTNAGVPWQSVLTADLASRASPPAQYTMLIPPDTNNPATLPPQKSPGGDGYILIKNSPTTATLSGALADSTAVSQSVPISQMGYVPMYANLYAAKGLLLGWINLAMTNGNGGALAWIHPVGKGLYASGFTNLVLTNLPISRWTDSHAAISGLTNLVIAGTSFETGSNQLENIPIMIEQNFKIENSSGSTRVTGSVTPSTGAFTVTIGGKITGHGAILENSLQGGGYFLITNTAQSIQLEP